MASQRTAQTNVLDLLAEGLGELTFHSFVHLFIYSFVKYLLGFYASPCSEYWENSCVGIKTENSLNLHSSWGQIDKPTCKI